MSRSTAVIGAGAAGCAAAHALAQKGRHVVLFERDAQVGGRTTTWRQDGLQVDSGAGFFTNFYPTLEALMPKLGIRDQVNVLSRHSVLVQDGQRGELTLGSAGSFVRFPFLGARDKLRMASATAWLTVRYAGLDITSPESLSVLDDQSIAQDARRRVGETAYQVVVRSGIEPFWYFSCEEVSRALAIALQARAATARFYAFREGMDSICRALAANIQVQTSAEVEPLLCETDGRFLVRFTRAGKLHEERFDEVVVATTASVAHKLTEQLGEVIAPSMRAFLASQTYVPNVHASFVVDRDGCPRGTSSMFPCGPAQKRVAALSFNSFKRQCGAALPADKELVCVFLTADESRTLLKASEAEIYEHCWTLARAFCPELPARASPFRSIARAEAIPVHSVGRFRTAAALHELAPGPVVFAGDYLTAATVDGALRSGLRAAERLG